MIWLTSTPSSCWNSLSDSQPGEVKRVRRFLTKLTNALILGAGQMEMPLVASLTMFKATTFLIWLLIFSVSSFAQNNGGNNPNKQEEIQSSDKEGRRGYWEANLAGGNYLVALSRISSVSRHKYVLDGALIVEEVTVDTTGQALARFYLETDTHVSQGRDLADKAIALNPVATNYYLRAQLCDRLGDRDAALTAVARAIELAPDHLEYRQFHQKMRELK